MTLRDADRFKDKIEVSLDSRQIFFLFFGGAVMSCLVFVLGVVVGKRLEGRERVAAHAGTSPAVDPLAALDELAADEDEDDLSFASALTGSAGDKARPLGAVDTAPTPTAKPVSAAPLPRPVIPSVATVSAVATPAPALAPAPASKAAPAPAPALPATVAVQAAQTPIAAKAAPVPSAPPGTNKNARFTLQVSSFQDKGEAEAFASKVAKGGFRTYVVASDIPGRGRYYRVRTGEYGSHEEALGAKTDFEKRQHIIAYVTKL